MSDAPDPRILAAAKALHRRANPGRDSPWSRSDQKARWLAGAEAALAAADAVDPLRVADEARAIFGGPGDE